MSPRALLRLWRALVLAVPLAAGAQESGAPAAGDASEAERLPSPEEPPQLRVGGALRFNAFLETRPGERTGPTHLGDLTFDTFRIDVDGGYKGLLVSGEYRFYAGFQFLQHGYVGYAFTPEVAVHVGVSRVPFGCLPYASNSWFLGLGYYVGLEDDADLGAKLLVKRGPFDLQLAYYRKDEGSFLGKSLDSARYSVDLVRTSPDELGDAGLTNVRADKEVNQANARLAYTFQHGASARTEVGVSGMFGGIDNTLTRRMGSRWAAAAHVTGTYGHLSVQLQGTGYGFRPAAPAGTDTRFVTMGAFDAPYEVASHGYMLAANVAYTWRVRWGLIESVTAYNDFAVLLKREADYGSSAQNVTGIRVTAGPIITYVDLAAGRNHPWLGPNFATALAEGSPDARWHTHVNINVGYYF